VDRRGFLQQSGGALVSLSLLRLAPSARGTPGLRPPAALPAYGDSRDVWRERWKWDRIARTSHCGANCLGACSWNVFVRDGIAWREEQNAVYAASESGVPDFNPRGCQKGAAYTDLMYEPSRILHPLRRVGERGSGRWKRVSWDAALEEIADGLLDAAVAQGTGSIVYDAGAGDSGQHGAAVGSFFGLLNSTTIDSMAGVGDMPHGAVQTLGMYNVEGTSDDWFKSDFIVVWLGNPAYTRMPDIHYLHEARYRGAKLVVIAPDYNATAVHADYWLNPRVGTDAALGLAIAQVILSEGLHDEAQIREQTDLPILVREDTGRYLRASDVRPRESDALLYFWDEATGGLAAVPGCEGSRAESLALGSVRPALAGRYAVRLADGSRVHVSPVLVRLRRLLDAEYTPERAARVTGIGAQTIRRIARELAAAQSAMVLSGWGACKHYHSDLMQRAAILVMALTGNQGRSGGGFRVAAWWPVDGVRELSRGTASLPLSTRLRLLWRSLTTGIGWREFEQLLQDFTPVRGTTPLLPFLYAHGGYSEIWDRPELRDPAAPRSVAEYMKDSTDRGWIPIRPLPGTEPKVFLFRNANPLRRWPVPQIALKRLWPRFDLIVDVNAKFSTSGLHADLILPTSGYYERDSLKYGQSYLPYLVVCEKAVEPLGESKGEWEIFGLLARKVQERAQARGITTVRDAAGGEVDVSTLYDDWSQNGRFHESDSAAALDLILRKTPTTGNRGLDEARQTGLLPVVHASGGPSLTYAAATDFEPGRTLHPYARFVDGKQSWPTLSGRQQFLIDHPWYVEAGEALPVHKEGPASGGDHPLRLTGGHTRWSVHATWRDASLLLRLQRGGPAAWVSSRDAAARGVADGDAIRIFNDVGEFEAIAKVAPTVRPGQVVVYHAWEPYQFKGWRGQQEPVDPRLRLGSAPSRLGALTASGARLRARRAPLESPSLPERNAQSYTKAPRGCGVVPCASLPSARGSDRRGLVG
jgi:DMSO reductase family type II enzyme molybdopterin subunit